MIELDWHDLYREKWNGNIHPDAIVHPAKYAVCLEGHEKTQAISIIAQFHYSHSVPSGKSYYFRFEDALVVYSIPANKNVARFLLGRDGNVWELSRLWAPDGHRPNLLTEAISATVRTFRQLEPSVEALVSYADPNVGHSGFIYRAASWDYLGQCEDSRYYRDGSGQVVARRKFHSGNTHLNRCDILALGYAELKLPGKHRFARGFTRRAKNAIRSLQKRLGISENK